MKNSFLVLLVLILLQMPVRGQSERQEAIIVPVSAMGNVSETRKQILQNTLEDELKEFFRLIPQDRFEAAQNQAFEELDYEECTEDQCIIKIQEILQVENLFHLQVIGEGGDTQLSLKWVTLDEKRKETDYCSKCTTMELNRKVEGLTLNILGKSGFTRKTGKIIKEIFSATPGTPVKKEKETDVLREETAKPLKEYSVSLRTIGFLSTIDVSIAEDQVLGLFIESNYSESDSGNSWALSNNTGIYFGHSLTKNCIYCDTVVAIYEYASGATEVVSARGSTAYYDTTYYGILPGYQWFWENGFSILTLFGFVTREVESSSVSIAYNERSSEIQYIYSFQSSETYPYPAILFGYSF